MKKTVCEKCGNLFSNNNHKRHILSCNGEYVKFVKSEACKYCHKSWKELGILNSSNIGNHIHWCEKNPKHNDYKSGLSQRDTVKLMHLGRVKTGKLNQFVAAKLKGEIYENPLKGKPAKNPFKKHSEETKEILRKKALASNHRRLRKGMILYKDIWLDSSWEYELAKRLDYLQIKWIRPNSLIWIDTNGIKHNYFPDFYLSDYDIYLDPKNPAAYKNQIEKIKILENTYKNIIFICSLEECKLFNITTPVSPHAYTM